MVCGRGWYGWIEVCAVKPKEISRRSRDMSLVKSIERGINSSTYNPEAEKALREEKKQASETRQKYRESLFKMREIKSNMIQEKKASDYLSKNIDSLVNEQFKWLTANPDADFQTITDQSQTTSEKFQDISKTNAIILGLSVYPQLLRTIGTNALLKKQITEEKKKSLDRFADSLESWLKTTPTLTSEQILTKQLEIELELKELLEGTGENIPAVTTVDQAKNLEQQVQKKEQVVKKEEEADRNTFKLSRLLKETYSITMKVIGSLFIVMLILVSGMLTANDAIGRDPQYRILYFIYGGLGFPVMLFYYLYRWFFGTGPYIYRLLPLYTKPADTSLGRFFLFPFTYAEDQAARDAKTKFMTTAATLVGKEYIPPAGKLESLVEGLQSLVLGSSETAKKGVNSIVSGLEKMKLS